MVYWLVGPHRAKPNAETKSICYPNLAYLMEIVHKTSRVSPKKIHVTRRLSSFNGVTLQTCEFIKL